MNRRNECTKSTALVQVPFAVHTVVQCKTQCSPLHTLSLEETL
jgi:hypothetical protein